MPAEIPFLEIFRRLGRVARHLRRAAAVGEVVARFGWTPVPMATGGKTVYVSGQVSVNERGEVVGKGNLRAQTEQTFRNLRHALGAVGARFQVAAVQLRSVRTCCCADDSGTQPASGHIALVSMVEHEGRQVGIANTHLKWDPPGTPPAKQVGLRLMRELLDARAGLAPGCSSWIIRGDLNVTPDSAVVQLLQAAGFCDAYAGHQRSGTGRRSSCRHPANR